MRREVLAYCIAAISCAAAIGMLSLLPNKTPSSNDIANISFKHIVGYGILMGLCLLSFGRRFSPAAIAVGVLTYSAILELLQNGVPNREPEFVDMVANSLGIFVAWALTTILRRLGLPRA